jgi:4-carboxymuconolactone decarboxylase
MAISEFAKNYHEKMFPERTQNNQQTSAQPEGNKTGTAAPFAQTDPEFIEFFDNFAFDEVVNEEGQELDDKTRFMAILATLLGCLGIDEFVVSQCLPYIGYPRSLNAIACINKAAESA